MIEFITLLLGLAAGPQVVELAASDDVAEVRLLLNGDQVAVDVDAPWVIELDLGADLEPQLLEAVAYDADGRELARVNQRLNVPRPPAEARIVLERDAEGQVVAAGLTWESSGPKNPLHTRAWLDGLPLPTDDPRRIPIPPHDESGFHFIQVELDFSPEVSAQAQAVFGGLYLDQSQVDLTALPVVARGNAKSADSEQMAGWFTVEGMAPRVSAFEKGRLDLVLVRGPGVGAAVASLEGASRQGLVSGGSGSPGVAGVGSLGNIANMAEASATDRLRQIMAFDDGQRLRILVPRARVQRGNTVAMRLFALSPEITSEHGGMYWALRQDVGLPGLAPELRLADAVAVAALQAANANRRRGVLLVLAEEETDQSRQSVAQVRSYLTSIQVPLFVWRVGESSQAGWREWGDGEEITSFPRLLKAARRLDEELSRQRIVWLEGLHLPNQIKITSAARLEPAVASKR